MMEFIRKMFSENGEPSAMRMMCFISLIIGIIISFIGINKNVDLSSLSMLVGVFVGSAFTGKVLQKSQEVKGFKGDN